MPATLLSSTWTAALLLSSLSARTSLLSLAACLLSSPLATGLSARILTAGVRPLLATHLARLLTLLVPGLGRVRMLAVGRWLGTLLNALAFLIRAPTGVVCMVSHCDSGNRVSRCRVADIMVGGQYLR